MKARVSPTDLQRDGPAPERAGLFVLPGNYKKGLTCLSTPVRISTYIQKAARFTADAPKVGAFDLLRAAINGGYKLPAEGRTCFLRWVDFWGSCARCSINIPERQPHLVCTPVNICRISENIAPGTQGAASTKNSFIPPKGFQESWKNSSILLFVLTCD